MCVCVGVFSGCVVVCIFNYVCVDHAFPLFNMLLY